MLKEYYPEQIDRLIIEYPRLDLRKSVRYKSYNTAELFQALKMRNEIWSHLMGQRQKRVRSINAENVDLKRCVCFLLLSGFSAPNIVLMK